MKRNYILLMTLLVLAVTACNENEKILDRQLYYNGPNPIRMALKDSVLLDFMSDFNVTVKSDNDNVTILDGGFIYGNNVGEANIKIDNYYYKITIPINVDLFIEPMFDFGCGVEKIIGQYGIPDDNFGDTILAYGDFDSTNMFISYACTEMNFLLNENGKYYKSDIYVNGNLGNLLGLYMDEKFTFDSICNSSSGFEYEMYHSKTDSSLKCSKFGNANQYGDFCLSYYKEIK